MAKGSDTLVMRKYPRTDLGRARLEPADAVIAGDYGTWRIVYRVGTTGLSTGGRIRISTDSDTDGGWPQLSDPSAAEYVATQAPDDAEVALRLADHRTALLIVTGRPLRSGEEIALTYGDRSGGGPGSRAQTFSEDRRYFWVEVDPDGSGKFAPLADVPELAIVGGDARRLVVTAPSDAVAGEPFRVLLKAEDAWGNPAAAYRGRVRLNAAGLELPEAEVQFGESDRGLYVLDGCQVTEPGAHRIEVADDDAGLVALSNPVMARDEPPAYRLFWGDPHGGQVTDPRKIGDFFRYARDAAGIHFAGFQRNDHVMANDAYALQQKYEREYYEPGRFVPLPGFEWSGELEAGGHHNVYFRRFERPIRRSGHRGSLDRSDLATDLPHVRELHRAYRHGDVVITPHVGGVHADLTYHEPELEPAVEVTSTHGTFEWFLRETLERRYKVGFVGGSDCYTGRPGDDHPGHQLRRYAKAGLAGVYARELTLESVLEAIKSRRCYATTGVRIVAALSADGHMMGSEYVTAAPPVIEVSVSGTAPLERVQLFRGLEQVYEHELGLRPSPDRVRVTWEGASRKSSYSGVVWDGRVRISSGKIRSVDRIRFDSPRSRVSGRSDDGLRWHSWTCGYRSGVVLGVDTSPGARIEVLVESSTISGARYGGHGDAAPQRISFAPADRVRLDAAVADLASGPREIDLGILDRRLTLEMAPEPGPERVAFSFRDPSPQPGVNPYWVKVTQSDMEMAWTSPVFVDYAPDATRA